MNNILIASETRNHMPTLREVYSHPNFQSRGGMSLIARLIREQENTSAEISNLVGCLYNNRQYPVRLNPATTNLVMKIAIEKSVNAAFKANQLKALAGQISDLDTQRDPVVSRLFTSSIYSANSANAFAQSAKSKHRQFIQEELIGEA